MKNKITLICTLFIFSISVSLSQQLTNPVQGIIAGTKVNYEISLSSGEVIKAKILNISPDNVHVKLINNSVRTIPRSDIINVELIPYGTNGSVGAGFGVPYGLIGFNFEFAAVKNLYPTIGLGTAIFVGGPMINVGAKYYLKDPNNLWRPRLSVYYGNNALLYVENYSSNGNFEKKYKNFSFGIGQMFAFGYDKRHGFDLDIIYVANNELVDDYDMLKNQGVKFEIEATGNIKISMGYRLNF